MENAEAIKRFNKMIEDNTRACEKVKRTKWRPSEKAMAMADFERDSEALRLAIRALGG